MTNRKLIIKVILFSISLVGLLFVLLHIKKSPHKIFIILSFIPIGLFVLKNKKLFSGYFYLYFGIILGFNSFFIYYQILDLLFPRRNIIKAEDGMEHLTMDISWIWVIPLSILTSFFILKNYRHKLKRKPKEELIYSIIVLVLGIGSYALTN